MRIDELAAVAASRFTYRCDGALLWRNPAHLSGRTAGKLRADGYVDVRVAGRFMKAHRLIWLMHNGELPAALDHINGVRSDNRIENLRPASHGENGQNKVVVSGAVRFKGVCFHKQLGRFQAQITKDRRCRYLGVFDTPEDAARAYDSAAIQLFGSFARTNASLGLL